MKNLFVLFSILVFSGLIVSASAQTNHIVINEIDTNPPGDDTKYAVEWVELYNPTSSKVDISGWQIASTTGLKKTLVIPTGTFIESGKFLTFSYQSLWFTDTNDLIELKDKSGIVVDRTPLIADLKNDHTSWQRIYDGYDFDNINDWKFVTATAGSSNGKMIVAEEKKDVAVSIMSDKSSYIFGDTAVIQGQISKQLFITSPYFHAEEIIVKISGPNFAKTISLHPDLNLNYKTSLNLQQVLGINKGDYSVSVSYGGATAQTSFSVNDKVVIDSVSEVGVLSLATDKTQYLPGETLLLTGSTTKVIPFEGLKFNIKDPNGKIIFTGSLYPTNGKFSTNVFLTTVNPVYGKYQITGEYFDKGAFVSFEVVKDIKENKAISLWTDKETYGLGETVTVTGRLNNVWVNFMDLEIIQTTTPEKNTSSSISGFKILDIVKISGDGSFTYSFKIPDSAIRLGDYKISISKDVGTASKVINVVPNPGEHVTSTTPFSISTDKVIYDLGNTMKITGFIANYDTSSNLQVAPVKILISNEDGSPLNVAVLPQELKTRQANGKVVAYELTAIPDSSGRFSTSTPIAQNIFTEGSYKIKAEYRQLVQTTTVGIVDPLKSGSGILLSLNKQVYGLGETVLLTGITPPISDGSVKISLTKSDGSVINSGAVVNNQRLSWSWVTPIAEKPLSIKTDDRSMTSSTNYGIYKIHVSTASAGKDIFFKVSADPANDSLLLSPVSVSAEKSLYKSGEKLKVVGNVIKREQESKGLLVPERVTILVIDGKFPFKQIREATVYPDHSGNFFSLFELPVTIFSEGEYKIKAMYAGKQSESKFAVANDFAFGSTEKLSLLLITDKSKYNPGDTVTISGKPNKLIYLEKFDISVIQKTPNSLTCGSFYCGKHVGPVTTIRPSPSGSFSHQIQLPTSTSSIGQYEITVDAGFTTKSLVFDVVEKTVVLEPKKSPTNTIEKVNRILDDKITITTNKKTVDDTQLSPRVLSGSLITTKVDQSNVNLRVTSESGTCIIGPDEICLVKDSTKKPGQIYENVSVDGVNLKVRYTGSDVYLEKFDIIPESSTGFLPNANWKIDVIKDDQPSRFYYKINYKLP